LNYGNLDEFSFLGYQASPSKRNNLNKNYQASPFSLIKKQKIKRNYKTVIGTITIKTKRKSIKRKI
jgi:hypothetical protein